MEINVKPEKLRRDKTPSVALENRQEKEYLWLCPQCRRAIRLPYHADKPLPSCMGGPKPHARQMLVCESYDVYQECFYRWMKGGESLGRPIIYPRNYYMFPVLSPTDALRDLAQQKGR